MNLKTNSFILSITTYNRLNYLKELLNSWLITKSDDVNWKIIIADDGSTDGTVEYIENLSFDGVEIILIKNKRIGIHQQMNTVIEKLDGNNFDICFKVDDDIEFIRSGWDKLYYNAILQSGYEHLVFCDNNWQSHQFMDKSIIKNNLIGKTSLLNSHGFLYTITPNIIKKVGYFNSKEFGFRGMGHVDYTARCCRAGYNDINNPFDVVSSNDFISATKRNYKSAIKSQLIALYDSYNRNRKEDIILNNENIYIESSVINQNILEEFNSELLKISLLEIDKLNEEIVKKDQVIDWYDKEITKIKQYYHKKYDSLPKLVKQITGFIPKNKLKH